MQSKQTFLLPEGDRIVAMQTADLDAVHQLECACQQDPWSRQHFVDEFDNPAASLLLYWRSQQLIGFLCSWLIAGELQIQNLVTSLALRRQGIAARLLEHAIDSSRPSGLTSICLEVRINNTAAIALYQRFGFSAAGRRCAYYPDGEDALIMVRDAGRVTRDA